MARRVNKGLVALIGAFLFGSAAIAGMMFVHRLQQTDPTHYLELAEGHAKNREWEQAKVYFWRAYNVSQDPRYLVQAGEMLYETGDEMQALQTWRRAITDDPRLVEAHERIIDLFVEVAETYRAPSTWRNVKEAADALLAVDPQSAKALYAEGLALLELPQPDEGNPRRGFEQLRRAVQLAPEVVAYSIKEATYAHQLGHAEDAERILRELSQKHDEPGEDGCETHVMYGKLLGAMGRHDEAEKMFVRAEALAADDPRLLADAKAHHAQYWIARWFHESGSGNADSGAEYRDRAQKLLEESIATDASAIVPYMLLAEVHARLGDHGGAIEVCERRLHESIRREGIKAHEQKFGLYLLYLKAAEECLAHAATIDRNSSDYDALIAKAESYAQRADEEFSGRGPGLHTMARIKLAQGRELEAIELLQRAATAFGKPNWQNSLMLARALLSTGQAGAAKAETARAIEDAEATPECWTLYSEILTETNEYELAVEMADEALRRRPGDIGALRSKMRALTRMGRMDLAERIREVYFKGRPEEELLRAQILLMDQRWDEALEILEPLLQREPDNSAYLRLAVGALTRLGRQDRALALVRQALEKSPDDVQLRLFETIADQSVSPEERDKAQLVILKSIADPFERDYQLVVWYGEHNRPDDYIAAVGRAEEALNDPSNGLDQAMKRRYMRDIVEREFTFAADRGDAARVSEIVEKAVRLNIDGADGASYRGRQHIAEENYEQAVASLKLAVQKQPSDARALTLLGQCYLKLDPPQFVESENWFERAVSANPNAAAAHKGLAFIAGFRKETDSYERHLAECKRLIPDDPWVADQLSLQEELRDPQAGIERREAIRKREPNNVDNLLKLAQFYAAAHQNDQAADCYRGVLAIGEPAATTVYAASQFFNQIGNHDEALRILEDQAEKSGDTSRKIKLVLLIANHWHALGDYAKSEEALERAASIEKSLEVCVAYGRFKSERGEYQAALGWFDKAIALAEGDSSEAAAPYRRSRIDVLLRSADMESAEREVDDYARRYPDDPFTYRLRAAVAAASGRIDEAIAGLDRFLEIQPNHRSVMFQRAKLLSSQGRWSQAIGSLERLRSIDPGFENYEARILLADNYALVHQVNLAYEELERILREDPTAKNVGSHLIDLYREHERFSDAVRVCTAMANRYSDEPVWLRTRAEVRTKLADRQGALSDYLAAVELAKGQPEYVSYAASLLAAYARFGQALAGIQFYEQQVSDEYRAPEVTLRYGELLALSGQRERAVELFVQALHQKGFEDIRFLRDLTVAIKSSCGGQSAIDLFRGPQDDPGLDRAAGHIRALLLSQFQLDSEALTTMESLLASSEDAAEKATLLASTGTVYERQEKWDLARETYERLLVTDPQNIIGLNNLAYLLSDKLGRPGDAVVYARRAAAVHPILAVRDTLAWALVQLGENREAIAILTKLLEENARYVPAIFHLGEAYRRSGEWTRAENLLTGALNLIEDGVDAEYEARVRESLRDVGSRLSAP